MEAEKITTAINELPLGQKLVLAQNIWDSIAEQSGKLPMPEWQRLELKRRYSQYQNNKLELHNWRKVHDELRAKHK